MHSSPQSLLSKVGWPTSRHLILGLALAALLLAPIREVSAVELNVLAAGAVEAVVRNVVGSFEKESGHTVKLAYAPVGALRDKIYAGEPADLTIVTPVIIEQLLGRGLVRAGTRTDLGRVGAASPSAGEPPPGDRDAGGAETGALGCARDLLRRSEDRYRRRLLPPGGGSSGDRGGGAQEGPDGRRRQGLDGVDGEIDRRGHRPDPDQRDPVGAGGRAGRPISWGLTTHDDVHRDPARAYTAFGRCGGVSAVSDQLTRAGAIQAARLRGADSIRRALSAPAFLSPPALVALAGHFRFDSQVEFFDVFVFHQVLGVLAKTILPVSRT